ncbi:MAG: alanine--tRNA ligase [Anaerolineae bacterium]|nr:alanine--tRNA ligase [Anaerolineae bacterium]
MRKLTAQELRRAYIDFFRARGHAEIRSAPLIPEHDPTVLFTTAGMHPLVPFLLGQPHPLGRRLVDVQKCMRTDDIDDVGDRTHLTFFEMLGNWSLGDYFKREAITWSYEFLTQVLEIPPERLYVSCFAGDADAPRDEESAAIWRSLGIPPERIYFFGKEFNWWGPAGKTGPCGPDTEMFVFTGGPCTEGRDGECDPSCSCGRYVEVWNDVFMEYNKTEAGTYEPLAQRNVDTGMGLERTLAVLHGYDDVFRTDLFTPIIEQLEAFSGRRYEDEDRRAMRIVADHVRAATFIIADGVLPSNVEQGYILRRILRRAMRFARMLGIDHSVLPDLATLVAQRYGEAYPELLQRRDTIAHEIALEEGRFLQALQRGEREFERLLSRLKDRQISGRDAFYLYETYGFPLELTAEMARERGLTVDQAGFQEAYTRHQELSRAGAELKFAGGLADHTEETTRLHTATHLLHAALRLVLGEHVHQAGSNITAERLRFDFTHPEKLTDEQIARVEELVNQAIAADYPVCVDEMSLEEAQARGALAFFGERYGDRVRVYSIADFSMEVCGGPHVERTGQLGHFRIQKQEAVGRGLRRIRAVLE